MSSFRSGALIALLGLTLLALLAARTARADGHTFGGVGLILLSDLATQNDGLLYYIDGVSLPGEGEAYEGWLVNSATGERLSTGVMEVGDDASIVHVYRDPDGESILEQGYDTIEITLEPVPDTDAGPGRTVYSYTQPERLWIHIQHLISHGVSPERAREHVPGDPDRPGDLQALRADLEAAIGLADAAMRAETLDGFRESVRRLLALEERLLLEEAAIHTGLAVGVHGPGIDIMAALVDYYVANAEALTLRVRERALAALEADSLEAGKAALVGADDLRSARGAVARSYRWAQLAGAFPVPAQILLAEYDGAPVAPLAALQAADRDPFGGFGLVVLSDEVFGSGGVVYEIDGAALPGEGEAYEGWLVNSATGERLSTGVMEVGDDASIVHVYRDPDGESILEQGYDTIEITLEPVPDTDAGPGRTVYSYTQPERLWIHIQHLISHGVSPERAREHVPGDPDRPGDLQALRADLEAAIGLADAAMRAETLDGFRESVRRLLALEERLLQEEAAIRIHTALAAGARGPAIDLSARLVGDHVSSAEARTLRVRDQAQAALEADSLEAGKAALVGASGALTSARGAITHAREWALRMVNFPVPPFPSAAASGPMPAPPEDGNAGLAAAGGGPAAWQLAALLAAIGALAGAVAHARRSARGSGAA